MLNMDNAVYHQRCDRLYVTVGYFLIASLLRMFQDGIFLTYQLNGQCIKTMFKRPPKITRCRASTAQERTARAWLRQHFLVMPFQIGLPNMPSRWSQRIRAAVFFLVVLVCLAWTVWLIALTLSPNETINWIMRTGDLDEGTFWHFPDSAQSVAVVGVAGLAIAALGCVYVLWVLVRIMGRTQQLRRRRRTTVKMTASNTIHVASGPTLTPVTPMTMIALFTKNTNRVATEFLTRVQVDETWQRLNTMMKGGDVGLHCVLLVQLLEEGMPRSLVGVFAAVVALHSSLFAAVFVLSYKNMGRLHMVMDAFFDLMVAVVFPMLTVLHAISLFTFDQPLMEINVRVFPPGLFERYAATVADPLQVVAVRRSLASLQVNSVLKIFTRVGTLLSLVRRFAQLAWMLVDESAGEVTYLSMYAPRQRLLGVVFVIITFAVVVFTDRCVRTSALACAPHRECAQHAHRWIIGHEHDDLTRCPCLAIIDRDLLVSGYSEWIDPPSRTAMIAQLATPGLLQTIQLVNRGLTVVPPELRKCKHLRHVSLYYTNTETLPEWFGEFTQLEFLHIEGKYPRSSLRHLPENLFANMPALSFLHLAIHGLDNVPSLDRLMALKSLTLAGLPMVTTLPRLDFLNNLKQLSVIGLPRIETFPEISNLGRLSVLTVADRGAFCCNGFLGEDTCDLSHSMCQHHPLWDVPPVTSCIAKANRASNGTRTVFEKFPLSACNGEVASPGLIKLDSSLNDVAQCNGTLYRQCHVTGFNMTAMCYNTRWMVIACNTYPFAMEMRRQQIKLGLGPPCDRVEEAWLGCGE